MPWRSVEVTTTSRSGALTGIGLRISAFTTPKMAVFAPRPNANVRTAIPVENGCLANTRML